MELDEEFLAFFDFLREVLSDKDLDQLKYLEEFIHTEIERRSNE